MQIQNVQEVYFIVCEMERGAIRLYERAMIFMENANRSTEPLYKALGEMLADERRHLRQFSSLYVGLDAEAERQLMLSAIADGILFEGGLMGAARQGMLHTVEDMLACAYEQECKAENTYRHFAEQTEDRQAREVLLAIADEENRHLLDIQASREAE